MKLIHRHPLAFLAFALASTPNLANGSVTLHPGDNIQSVVNANPGDTTFVFDRWHCAPTTPRVFFDWFSLEG
jgi:hypothetical protein